jgi:hypothetical protein
VVFGPQKPTRELENLGKHWVSAAHLELGDKIRKADGSSGIVLSVVNVVQARVMYNLEVAGNHDFFVGENGWLVHNSEGISCFKVTSYVGYSPYAKKIASSLEGEYQTAVDQLLENLDRGIIGNSAHSLREHSGRFVELRNGNGRVIVYKVSNNEYDIVGKFGSHAKGDKANSAMIDRLIADYREVKGIK